MFFETLSLPMSKDVASGEIKLVGHLVNAR
jgi:hypothetical protein